jgi:hypothetical protein
MCSARDWCTHDAECMHVCMYVCVYMSPEKCCGNCKHIERVFACAYVNLWVCTYVYGCVCMCVYACGKSKDKAGKSVSLLCVCFK